MSMYSDIQDFGATGWLVGAVKNNPEGLLLLAAGCALLMRSTGASKSRRSRDARVYDRNDMTQSRREARDRTVGERLSDTAKSAGEYVSDIGESVVETASSYASSVSGYADDVARTAAEQTGRFAQQAKSGIGDTISRVVQEQPLTVASGWRRRGGGSGGCFSGHRSGKSDPRPNWRTIEGCCRQSWRTAKRRSHKGRSTTCGGCR